MCIIIIQLRLDAIRNGLKILVNIKPISDFSWEAVSEIMLPSANGIWISITIFETFAIGTLHRPCENFFHTDYVECDRNASDIFGSCPVRISAGHPHQLTAEYRPWSAIRRYAVTVSSLKSSLYAHPVHLKHVLMFFIWESHGAVY